MNSIIDGLALARHWERDITWLEVVHAAPRALFSGEMLKRVRQGEQGLEITLDRLGLGAVLRIRGRNRTVVYRLAEYDEKQDVFTGVWPD